MIVSTIGRLWRVIARIVFPYTRYLSQVSKCRIVAFEEMNSIVGRLSIAFIMFCGIPANAESLSERLGRGNYFAASNRNAAFPIRDSDNLLVMLLVDYETGKKVKLRIRGSDLLSPFLSPEGDRFLFVNHPRDKIGRELISCDTTRFACVSLLANDGLISFPVLIAEKKVLYVASPYSKDASGRGRYNIKDLWIFSPSDGIRRLTDMRVYDLSAISASRSSIYFSAVGPPKDNPVIPKFNSSLKARSDIFQLPFDPLQALIKSFTTPLIPLFDEQGISTGASVSFDDALVAFARTRSDIGAYRYDLVVINQVDRSTRLIPSEGAGFSRPIIVDRSVYANAIYADRFLIQVLSPGEHQMRTLVEVTDKSIDAADAIEISLK